MRDFGWSTKMKSRRFLSRTSDDLAWPNLAIRRAGISESQISESFVTFALFVVRKSVVESQPKILQIERERIKNRLKYPQTPSSSPISQFSALFFAQLCQAD